MALDEKDKARIGEEVEPGDRPKAPGRLALLQGFMNTENHDLPREFDRLGTPHKARAWLRRKRLLAPGGGVSEPELARLHDLREALRELAMANHGSRPPRSALDVLRRESDRAGLRVAVDTAGRTSLEPRPQGVDGAVAALLVILHEAQVSGHWTRMKGCRRCRYAFFDRSKNRSAAWCTMTICGNRTKNRTYYRRRSGSEA